MEEEKALDEPPKHIREAMGEIEERPMKPTMRLRWKRLSAVEARYPALIIGGTHLAQELQQWWENDKGEGEWRTVPIESPE